MTTPPPSRRASHQVTSTGLYVSEIADPLIAGKRLRLSASTAEELADDRRVIVGWKREYRRSALSLDEFRDRLARFENARAPAVLVRDAWEAHIARSRVTVVRKLRSIWKRQIAPELGDLAVVQLTARMMGFWDGKQIAAGYAPKTTMDAWMNIVAAVRLSLRDGEDLPWKIGPGKYWKPSRPAKPRKERPAALSLDEVERLVAAALEEDRAQRLGSFGRAMARRLADLGTRCAVILFMALRNGEGSGLGWDDLALEGPCPRARVIHQATDQWRTHHPDWPRPLDPPKGGKTRELVLHPTAVAALVMQRDVLQARGWYRDDGPVFPSHEGSPFAGTWRPNANAIKPADMKRVADAAGLPFSDEWVTHSLRHSASTIEHVSGADLRSIGKRTGHRSLRALEDYIHARLLPASAIPELALTFDADHDTEPCPPPEEIT